MDIPFPVGKRISGYVSVIVMEPTKLFTELLSQLDNLPDALLRDAGSIHARIDVDKNANPGILPPRGLFESFDQNRNARARKIFGDFERALRIRAHDRICKED